MILGPARRSQLLTDVWEGDTLKGHPLRFECVDGLYFMLYMVTSRAFNAVLILCFVQDDIELQNPIGVFRGEKKVTVVGRNLTEAICANLPLLPGVLGVAEFAT